VHVHVQPTNVRPREVPPNKRPRRRALIIEASVVEELVRRQHGSTIPVRRLIKILKCAEIDAQLQISKCHGKAGSGVANSASPLSEDQILIDKKQKDSNKSQYVAGYDKEVSRLDRCKLQLTPFTGYDEVTQHDQQQTRKQQETGETIPCGQLLEEAHGLEVLHIGRRRKKLKNLGRVSRDV